MRDKAKRAILLGAVLFALAPDVRAQSAADACATAAEESQPLRTSGKLTAAREKLLVCSKPACPAVVRNDCAKWLADVERQLPSVVIRAVDSHGKDVTNVRVLVDGSVLQDHLDGRPVAVDPGEHQFRYESPGLEPVVDTVLVRQSETNRMLTATFAPPAATPPPPPPPPPPRPQPETGGKSVFPYILGGAGIVSVGIGSILWIVGTNEHDTMANGCAKTHSCLQSDVDSAKTKLYAGDVLFGLGVVAVGVAAVLYFTQKSGSAPAASMIDVRPLPGGGAATLARSF